MKMPLLPYSSTESADTVLRAEVGEGWHNQSALVLTPVRTGITLEGTHALPTVGRVAVPSILTFGDVLHVAVPAPVDQQGDQLGVLRHDDRRRPHQVHVFNPFSEEKRKKGSPAKREFRPGALTSRGRSDLILFALPRAPATTPQCRLLLSLLSPISAPPALPLPLPRLIVVSEFSRNVGRARAGDEVPVPFPVFVKADKKKCSKGVVTGNRRWAW